LQTKFGIFKPTKDASIICKTRLKKDIEGPMEYNPLIGITSDMSDEDIEACYNGEYEVFNSEEIEIFANDKIRQYVLQNKRFENSSLSKK